MENKNKKSHTTIYFPKSESEFLMRAIKVRGQQLFGKSSHGKASAYLMKLIRKDLKEQGLLSFDPKKKQLIPAEEKLNEIEAEILKKYEENIMDGLV